MLQLHLAVPELSRAPGPCSRPFCPGTAANVHRSCRTACVPPRDPEAPGERVSLTGSGLEQGARGCHPPSCRPEKPAQCTTSPPAGGSRPSPGFFMPSRGGIREWAASFISWRLEVGVLIPGLLHAAPTGSRPRPISQSEKRGIRHGSALHLPWRLGAASKPKKRSRGYAHLAPSAANLPVPQVPSSRSLPRELRALRRSSAGIGCAPCPFPGFCGLDRELPPGPPPPCHLQASPGRQKPVNLRE